MLFDICVGLAALWSAQCQPFGDARTRAAASASLAAIAGPAFEAAGDGHSAAIRHRASGLLCRFDPAVPPQVEPREDMPASCTINNGGERIELMAVPLEGSGGVGALIALERMWIAEIGPATVEARPIEGGQLLDWSRADRRGFLGVVRRGEWLIVMRRETADARDAADLSIWAGVIDALSQ